MSRKGDVLAVARLEGPGWVTVTYRLKGAGTHGPFHGKGGSMRTLRFAAAGTSLFLVLAMAGAAQAAPVGGAPGPGPVGTVGSPTGPLLADKPKRPAAAPD